MQHQHYSAQELAGDDTFPSHLDVREARQLVLGHGHQVETESDGTLKVTYWCSKGETGFNALKRFSPNNDGLFRASPILLFLGY